MADVISLAERRRQQREKQIPRSLDEKIQELDSAIYTLLDTVHELQDRIDYQEKLTRKLSNILISLAKHDREST